MTAQRPEKTFGDGVSPYLQQPLRSFEQAQLERKRLQLEAADADGKASRQGDQFPDWNLRFKA